MDELGRTNVEPVKLPPKPTELRNNNDFAMWLCYALALLDTAGNKPNARDSAPPELAASLLPDEYEIQFISPRLPQTQGNLATRLVAYAFRLARTLPVPDRPVEIAGPFDVAGGIAQLKRILERANAKPQAEPVVGQEPSAGETDRQSPSNIASPAQHGQPVIVNGDNNVVLTGNGAGTAGIGQHIVGEHPRKHHTGGWWRRHTLELGVVLALLTLIGMFVVPEVRRFFRLTPASESSSQPSQPPMRVK